jgi:hypothetical protein
MVLLLWSHLCTVLVDPLPAPHALDRIAHFVQFAQCWWTHSLHPMHWIVSRISSNLQGLQNQFGLHFVTRSGQASLRFLASHETLYSS